ncbi:MAG: potassium channel family protein [Polyangiales bacterium]
MPLYTQAPNYGRLLALLLLLIVGAPLVPRWGHGLVFELVFALMMLAAASHAAWRRGHRHLYLWSTALAFALRTAALLWRDHLLAFAAAQVGTTLWLLYTVVLTGRDVATWQRIDRNALMGALVAYLLSAFAFASLYHLIEGLWPASFAGVPEDLPAHELAQLLLYFSLVCITTLGFGDIAPTSVAVRPWVALEAVYGVMYVAVTMAHLVALQKRAKR